MYHTLPLVTICKLQKPGKFKTRFFGALVPCLTSEVRQGTCLHPILRMCLLFFFFYPLSSINYLFPLCNRFRPVGRVDAASDGAMCWELLAAGRQFSRVLGTSWSCEGELGTSWLLKGRLYFQKCCHHLLLVFQAEENMCNPFETIQLLKKIVYFIM